MIFDKKRALITICLLFIEIFIALFITGGFVRTFVGDLLSVCLLYSLATTFLKVSKFKLGIGVLLFAFSVEFAQYFNLVEYLNFSKGSFGYIILGATFDPNDLIAYTFGVLLCWVLDYKLIK